MTFRTVTFQIVTAGLTLALLSSAVWAEDFDGFRQDMTVKEYEEAGLDKLSDQELAKLEAWIKARMERAPAQPTRSAPPPERARQHDVPSFEFGMENARTNQQSMTSRIDGEFRGWDGDTLFRLENGQVWEQIGSERVFFRAYRPEVTITREMFGYRMSVEGINARVQVKRIE